MVAAGALTVAIGGGIWAGQPAAPADPAEPPLGRVVRAGPATLLVPRQWRTSSRSTGATTVLAPSPGAPGRVIVTLAAADDRSLVPKPLRDLAQDLGRGPRGTRFAGHLAWRYVGHGRDGNRFDVTVLPTSAGVLGLACEAITPAECAPAIESITLRRPGAAIYAPSPDFTLRLRLPGVLAALDRERVDTRSALRRAATHTRQAQLAHRLERAHLAAANALRPVAGGAGASLPGELSNAASTYSALADAASAGSAARFDAAARNVRGAEARLRAATDRFLNSDAPVAIVASEMKAPSRSGAAGGPDPARIALVIAALLSVGMAAILSRRRQPPEHPPAPPAKVNFAAPAAVRGRPRRPADPSARWDAPPAALRVRAESNEPSSGPSPIDDALDHERPGLAGISSHRGDRM